MGDCLVRRFTAWIFIVLVHCLLVFSTATFAADSTKFRIQDYIPERFTDFQWRLDGSAKTSKGTPEADTSFSDNVKRDQTSGFSESGSSRFTLKNNWRYVYETRQGALDCNFGITTAFDHNDQRQLDSLVSPLGSRKTWDSKNQQSVLTFESPLEAELRRYVLGEAFLEAGGRFWYYYFQRADNNDDAEQYVSAIEGPGWRVITDNFAEERGRNVSRRIDFQGELRLGWGRVYRGGYAATAISIVDQLRRSGLVARSPNREDMLELTKLIHAYREGHGTDKREYRAQSLKSVVTFLHLQGIVAEEHPAVLLSVEDVLDYFSRADRRFGWSVQFGFGGHDVYYNNQFSQNVRTWSTEYRWNPDSSWIADTLYATHGVSENSSRSRDFAPTDYVILKLDFYRPLSARWQLDLNAGSRFYLEPSMLFKDRAGFAYRWSLGRRTVSTRFSLQYFHDARTTLSLACTWIDSVRTERSRLLPDVRLHNWLLALMFLADYKLSPATTLNMEFLYYRRSDFVENSRYATVNKQRHFDVSAGITHWLF